MWKHSRGFVDAIVDDQEQEEKFFASINNPAANKKHVSRQHIRKRSEQIASNNNPHYGNYGGYNAM